MKTTMKAILVATTLSLALTLTAGAAIPIWLASGPVTATFHVGTLPTTVWWHDGYYGGSQDYGDWTVGNNTGSYIDGDGTFIWLRNVGDWAQTTIPGPHTMEVIAFGSDSNDGCVEIWVDGNSVAYVDSWSNPGVYWYIKVVGLPLAPHTIKVMAVGETTQMPPGNGNDDVSLDGAGTLDGSQAAELGTWTSLKSLY
ncbi:hypothetical protein H8E52_01540 [bacterium]|nr:hypothetical protein [bacterium]